MQPELNRKAPVSSTVSDWRIGEAHQANSAALAGNPDSCFLELLKETVKPPLLLSPLSLWQNPSPYDPRTNDNCYTLWGQQRQGPGPQGLAVLCGNLIWTCRRRTRKAGAAWGEVPRRNPDEGLLGSSRGREYRTRFTGEAELAWSPETTRGDKKISGLVTGH